MRFLFPQPSKEQLRSLYDRDYFDNADSNRGYESYASEAENLRATFRNRLRRIPSPKAGNRLLDVGAAAGFFVEQARLKGWDAQGVEPSEWAARYANDILKQPVLHSTLERAGFPDESFDVLTLWEVIEHLMDPRSFLEKAARVLRPGGFLVLSTPDAGSVVARVLGKRWPGWSKVPEHLFFFDRANLTRLLRDTGFIVTAWRYVSIRVKAGFAARRLAATGVPFVDKLPKFIADINLSVNPLYDLMLTARRT